MCNVSRIERRGLGIMCGVSLSETLCKEMSWLVVWWVDLYVHRTHSQQASCALNGSFVTAPLFHHTKGSGQAWDNQQQDD